MSLGEFELIQRYFTEASQDASVVVGVGDDCAVLQPPSGSQLVVSIDTLVEGTHFLPETAPQHVASRLMGAALSDLAAMGATPAWMTLALTLPDSDEAWLRPFAETLIKLCKIYQIRLIGGDTTRGPLVLSAQVHGFVTSGTALLRKGAKVGDLICVSGTLGDSRAGLEQLLAADSLAEDPYLLQRFYAPTPRLELGLQLSGLASSCIDISDGLVSDLGHILQQSQVGAIVNVESLPLSQPLKSNFSGDTAQRWALSGGEDFELCFTLPEQGLAELTEVSGVITVIGRIVEPPGLKLQLNGQRYQLSEQGYDHFAG